MNIQHADFRIERHFKHTPQQVYSAFSEPELREQWFANAGKFDDFVWDYDFRVGGGEVSAGSSADRVRHEFKSRFHDIVPDKRIVFAYDLLIDHELISVSLATYEFLEEENGTRLVFSEQGAFFGGDDGPALREEGSRKLVDILAAFVERHYENEAGQR